MSSQQFPYYGDPLSKVAPLTTGGMWSGPYQASDYFPLPTVTYTQTEPTECIGKAHVFECAHTPSCKCGRVKRVVECSCSK
jgi:hypothetical protein